MARVPYTSAEFIELLEKAQAAYQEMITAFSNVQQYTESAEESKNSAAGYADAASKSAEQAEEYEQGAAESLSKLGDAVDRAKEFSETSEEWANFSKSYAIGETGTRESEDIDNARYYYEQAKYLLQSLEGALVPMGTILFSELAEAEKETGYLYNISDEFTTDNTFKEGPGRSYSPGTNVYFTADGYWDALAGYQVTGVRGEAEPSFRTGQVTISKENVGLGNVPNVATDNQTPNFEKSSERENIESGERLSVIFGKIQKFLEDLQNIAFSGAASDVYFEDGETFQQKYNNGELTGPQGEQGPQGDNTAITGAASTIAESNLTVNRALVSNDNGKVGVSGVTTTELAYLSGVTSAIQTQLNNKQAKSTYSLVTLTESGWENGLQTVAVSNVTSLETDQLIIPVPAIASQQNYIEYGIFASAQGANSLTFTAKITPSENVSVYVVIFSLK